MDVAAKDERSQARAQFSRVALSGAAAFWPGPAVREAGKRVNPDSPCVRVKFGIEERGKAGVTAAFTALSAHIRAGGLFMPDPMIRLGDYVDLEGGLEVEGYRGKGQFHETAIDYRELGGRGSQLRLVVVGINPFYSGKRAKAAARASAIPEPEALAENDSVPHLAFQFQNIPVVRQMNVSCSNAGGYAASAMRRYLTDVDGDGTGGAFLQGLIGAGVPKAALWAPARCLALPMAEGGVIVKDLLWLPAEGELFDGPADAGEAGEAGREDTACFEGYAGRKARTKLYNGTEMAYWTASPAKNCRLFSYVDSRGRRRSADADVELGCSPAFCVGHGLTGTTLKRWEARP
jgi:hypothetical protein